jgi:hypothetical protein
MCVCVCGGGGVRARVCAVVRRGDAEATQMGWRAASLEALCIQCTSRCPWPRGSSGLRVMASSSRALPTFLKRATHPRTFSSCALLECHSAWSSAATCVKTAHPRTHSTHPRLHDRQRDRETDRQTDRERLTPALSSPSRCSTATACRAQPRSGLHHRSCSAEGWQW